MVKTKTTLCGGSSHRPAGMAMARFIGTGRGKADLKSSSKTPQARTLRTAKTSQKCWKMLNSQRKVNRVQVSPRVRQVTSQHRPQKEQKPLLRKLHQIQTPPAHDQVQARIPPRFPLKMPPRPPPKTLTKKPHQFLLHMLKLSKWQAKPG